VTTSGAPAVHAPEESPIESSVSEYRMQAELDAIPVPICTARSDGSFEFVNKCWREYTGRALDEAKNASWTLVVHPDDLDRFAQRWRSIVAAGKPEAIEMPLRRFDGEYHRFLVSMVPFHDESGNIARWYATAAPTIGRESAGAETEGARPEPPPDIIEAAPVLLWSSLADGSNEFHNQRWLSYSNLSLQEAQGQGWSTVIHPDDVQTLMDKWQMAVSTGGAYEAEARFRRFDGEYRWFLSRGGPKRDNNGTIVKWYGTYIDIQDLKTTEEALRRSEAYLTEAQRLSLTGSFAWTPATGAMHWSEESFRIFQYDSRIKPTLELMMERVHPDDRTFVRRAFKETSKQETEFDVSHRLSMPDGSLKYVRIVSRTVKNSGRTAELIGAVMDITSSKQAEEVLRANERRLNIATTELSYVSRITTLGQLTASIIHDVSQPLSAIAANSAASVHLLAGPRPNIQEARRAIEDVIQEAERATAVITRMRQLFRRADPEKLRLDVNTVINDSMLLLRREADSARVQLDLDLAVGLPPIAGDRVQLQQVLINLAMNGIEAMASVTDGLRKLQIRTNIGEAEKVVVAVRDFGSGIDPAIEETLFSPFHTTKPTGMGMGLSICRSIIEAHGGRIWASRNEGQGSTFSFTLNVEPGDLQTV
jgi:PAS domain S-box-containing protein